MKTLSKAGIVIDKDSKPKSISIINDNECFGLVSMLKTKLYRI